MLIAEGIVKYGMLIKDQQRFGYLTDKIPVMGYEEQSAGIGLKCGFQGFSGGNVHVVGRLIQQKEIRPALEKLGQYQTGFFTAGQGRDFFGSCFSGEKECPENLPDILLCKRRKQFMEMFRHGEIGRKSSGLLVKISDQDIEPQAAGTFYRRQQSGGRFQKSRLSGTVGTDDTDFLSASNSQG